MCRCSTFIILHEYRRLLVVLAGGMAGTAMFVLNGVDMSLNPSTRLSYDDWVALIDPLLAELSFVAN